MYRVVAEAVVEIDGRERVEVRLSAFLPGVLAVHGMLQEIIHGEFLAMQDPEAAGMTDQLRFYVYRSDVAAAVASGAYGFDRRDLAGLERWLRSCLAAIW
jgi:hypothetical protein